MSTLFVTATWPDPIESFTHGVAQRLRLLLSAALKMDPIVDILVFAPWDLMPDIDMGRRLRLDFQTFWSLEIRHVFVARSEHIADRMDSLFRGYLLPMTSIHRQPSYARLSGINQASAVAAAVIRSKPRLLLAHRLAAMLPVLATSAPLPPVVLDLDDVEHKAFARLIALPPYWRTKSLLRGWLPALRRGERRALNAAQLAFVCSEQDQVYLRTLWGLTHVAVVPNAVPMAPPIVLPATKTALFLGMHSYEPNRVAAEFLIHEIWPLVHVQHPNAILLIAGKGCERIHGYGQNLPGVSFEGFQPNLQELYARTRVVCCPIQSGGGTRVKIVEGAMYGRPVVSTELGAEGLDFSPARGEIFIADCADLFAQQISMLFSDDALVERSGQLARKQAIAKYSEDKMISHIASCLSGIVR